MRTSALAAQWKLARPGYVCPPFRQFPALASRHPKTTGLF